MVLLSHMSWMSRVCRTGRVLVAHLQQSSRCCPFLFLNSGAALYCSLSLCNVFDEELYPDLGPCTRRFAAVTTVFTSSCLTPHTTITKCTMVGGKLK